VSFAAFLGVAFLASTSAEAQQYVRRAPAQRAAQVVYRYPYQYQYQYQPQYQYAAQPRPAAQPARTAAPAATAPAAAATGDAYGFTNWLNATRAQYGLPAVGYDQNLANWAQQNNAQQAARGIGHYVMGPARRQNSAMGNSANIGSMWMASPAHRAALLDPSIRWIGLAGWGTWWTFNAL
jgi:uncharacterized protein YkwD